MAALKDEVLAALAAVPSPTARRSPRPENFPTSSSPTARFSSPSPSMPRTCSNGRACASAPQAAVRALPGVESVMIALTAERGGGRRPCPLRSPDGEGASGAAGATSPRSALRRPPMAPGARPGEGAPHATGLGTAPPAFPASPRSSRSPPARAASASRRSRSISRSRFTTSVSRSASSMPTSTGRRCQNSSPSASGRR